MEMTEFLFKTVYWLVKKQPENSKNFYKILIYDFVKLPEQIVISLKNITFDHDQQNK